MKQTAFNWYIEQHNIIVRLGDTISIADRFQRFWDIIEQAKEIEKQQIIDAYLANGDDGVKYYNETYGGNK